MLLLIGLFVPTLRVCGHPTAPIELPFVWGPHVVAALVFAVMVRPSHVRGLAIALQVLIGLSVGALGAMLPWPAWIVATAILVLLFIPPSRSWETSAARSTAIAGAASSVWFLAMALDRDAMIGAYTSAGASIAMTVGAIWWWIEAAVASRRERDGELGTDLRVL